MSGNRTKIILAAIRAVDFRSKADSNEKWFIEKTAEDQTLDGLKKLLKRYQKLEKQEREVAREAKEKNIVTNTKVNKSSTLRQ